MKKHGKIFKFMLTVFIFLVTFSPCVAAEENVFFETDAAKILDSAAEKSENIKKAYADFDFAGLSKKIARGENVFNPDKILKSILCLLFGEISSAANILTALAALAVTGGIITNLHTSFASKGMSEVAFFAFYAIYIGILASSFYGCLESAYGTVEEQSAFLQAAVPCYVSMLVMSGSPIAGGAAKSVLLYFISLVSSAVKNFFIPLSLMIFIMSAVNNLSGKIHITKFVNLMRLIVTRALAVMMTAFVSLMTLSGIGARSADTLSVRAAKYAAQNFVPVVGGILSGTVDTVFASASAVKNAFGVAGIIAVAVICAYPVLKFAALIFVYRFAASVIEPIADKRISNAVNEAANGISLLFSLVVCVTVGFSLAIAVLIGMGV